LNQTNGGSIGRIIVEQDDFWLPTWISWLDSGNFGNKATIHLSKGDVSKICFENPFLEPDNRPED